VGKPVAVGLAAGVPVVSAGVGNGAKVGVGVSPMVLTWVAVVGAGWGVPSCFDGFGCAHPAGIAKTRDAINKTAMGLDPIERNPFILASPLHFAHLDAVSFICAASLQSYTIIGIPSQVRGLRFIA
jgi:hypothetical protein